MAMFEERNERIESLQRLMDRLCASDLTLPEAAELRARLAVLLAEQAYQQVPTQAIELEDDPSCLPASSRPLRWRTSRGHTTARLTPCLCTTGA